MEATRNKLIDKKHRLEAAKTQLKSEFAGIDAAIDEVVDTLHAWYLLPDLQERPLIINLWGLTGVGKTSLVERLVELIGMDSRYFHIDMGDYENHWKVRNQLENIYDLSNAEPSVIVFDEFQYFRSIDEDRKEVSSYSSRFIWQLLDNGKLNITNNEFSMGELQNLFIRVNHLIIAGLQVENNVVMNKKAWFLAQTGQTERYPEKPWESDPDFRLEFITARGRETLFNYDRRAYNSPKELKQRLATMDGDEIRAYIQNVYERAIMPKALDCSKALIFVIGNLDEAYFMSRNLDPDIEADEFHELCAQITVPTIKKALMQRFRSEEIGRLGNNHVIYPAFNGNTYKAIIGMQLKQWADGFFASQGIRIDIDESVHALIYAEGVYPTLGTRPVFTTLHQIVQSKAGALLAHLVLQGWEADAIHLAHRQGELVATYKMGDAEMGQLAFPQPLKLGALRTCKRDDQQAIAAVHESGHAICSALLLGQVPESVVSTTANPDSGGFMFARQPLNFIAKREIPARLATFLGGYAAELLVFGEENLTTGAEGDIGQATHFIARLLKHAGMGDLPARYGIECEENELSLFDRRDAVNDQVAKALRQGLDLAMETLRREERLLLHMADYLSDHRLLTREQVIDLLDRHATDFDSSSLSVNPSLRFYRRHLKSKVTEHHKSHYSQDNNQEKVDPATVLA